MLLDCCGSRVWAERMTRERPFRMLDDLFFCAESIWHSLTPADWLEAFAAHPRIGSSSPSSVSSRSSKWSAGEQSQTNNGDNKVNNDLAEPNRLYEEKFGFIFIVCATGRSADEMLGICRARLGNSLAKEIKIAAHEQQEITELRLAKLLEDERHYNTCP